MMRLRHGLAVALALASLGGAAATAHETTRSYLTLERQDATVAAELRVAFRDIEVAAWMDEDLDGAITRAEAERRMPAIAAYVRAGLSLEAGRPCMVEQTGWDAAASGGIPYLELRLQGRCPSSEAPLVVRSRLFHEIDPNHRTFLQAATGGRITWAVLRAAGPAVTLDGDTGGRVGSLLAFFRAGVEHLLGGPDHLLFLAVLLLPAVCLSAGPRRAALGILSAVTGFTVAHALSLTAAATELLRPPPDLITLLIALSIVLTAADNLRPFLPASRTGVAAFFGLVHGFGFASALQPLHLAGAGMATALLGFNLGIEAAQVGAILVTVPALWTLRGGRPLLWASSATAAAAGIGWACAASVPLLAT